MKYKLIIMMLVMGSALLKAQNHQVGNRLERIKAQKVAFITQKVNLTTEEAQVFWPVYNEFTAKKETLTQKRRNISKEIKQNWQTASQAQKEATADQLIAFKLEEAQLDMTYHAKFKTILSIDKVLQLYQAETMFKKHLLNQLRKHPQKGNEIKPGGKSDSDY
ncbi:hypothetical protein DMA11_10165 [Marinilabiliaceae bacterium JC017]|nr:hypothetical protein DMA11_10165 [Marinilabiliaceae bacterium JC017]